MCRLLPVVLISVCVIGCEYKAASSREVLEYCNESKNGVRAAVEQGDLKIEFIYRPADLIVAQEIKGMSLAERQIDSVRSMYRTIDYFLMRVSKRQGEIETAYVRDPDRFNQVNNYLAYKIANDIKLVHKNDTIHSKAAIHTRTFGSSRSTDLLVAFESALKSRTGKVQLIFDDKMFDSGLHIVEFETADIRSIPRLDFTQKYL